LGGYPARYPSSGLHHTTMALAMNQQYINTVRAIKLILHNLDHLEEEITDGQRAELERLVIKLTQRLDVFLEGDQDAGAWIGEE